MYVLCFLFSYFNVDVKGANIHKLMYMYKMKNDVHNYKTHIANYLKYN